MRKERQGTGKCLVGCWDPGRPSPGVEEPWIWPRLALGYSLPCGREVWGGFCASKERKKQWPLCPLTLVTESWVGVLLGDKLGHFSLKAFLEQNIKAGERPEDYLGHWFFIVFFFFFPGGRSLQASLTHDAGQGNDYLALKDQVSFREETFGKIPWETPWMSVRF